MNKRAFTRSLLVAAGAVLAMGALGTWWMGSELVRPAPRPVPLPADFPARALTIPGTRIAAWWADRGAATPAVLLLHGKRGDRSSMLSRARLLVRHGFSVALIDLPAHGETPGTEITFGWREAGDVRSALAWLGREAPGRRPGSSGARWGRRGLSGPQPVG
jgi:predicted alpha/beta-fold hydrolase